LRVRTTTFSVRSHTMFPYMCASSGVDRRRL
jgi:hypothetical protein